MTDLSPVFEALGELEASRKEKKTILEALATRYDEGDEVNTPAGPGVVVEIRTEEFEGPDNETHTPSEDSPAYIVAVEDGARVYTASDLEAGEIGVDVDEPEEALEARVDIWSATGGFEALQDGFFSYPDSWQESETPARLILLKAWAGLGGRFTTCRREMAGEISRPNAFCADMKDRVLMWEGWRQ